MKIIDIYKKYKIMPNLALHQIRTASVAIAICDSLNISVEKDIIVLACLIHDMGNIIKFKLDYFPEFSNPEGLEYWQKVQYDYISKYGEDEHVATYQIAKELGIDEKVIELLASIRSKSIEDIKLSDDFNRKICIYTDGRVTPYGVVSLGERMSEAKKRYEHHKHAFPDKEHNFFKENIWEIENQIFSHSIIKPDDINDDSIYLILENLKNFEI